MVRGRKIILLDELLGRLHDSDTLAPTFRGSYAFRDLWKTLRAVYESVGQVEVYHSRLKIRRREREESLPNLAQDKRKLMALAYPSLQHRTTEILARDTFLDVLEDSELVVHAQNPPDLATPLRIALRMEAVL